MNSHLLLFMGLTCLLIVLFSWWHARKRTREVLLRRVTRKMERQIAEEIVRARLQDEVGRRAVDGLLETAQSKPSTDQEPKRP